MTDREGLFSSFLPGKNCIYVILNLEFFWKTGDPPVGGESEGQFGA
jgi:hypothetical protein